jgi:hypothetical protein
MTVFALGLPDHLAGSQIQHGEQAGGAVPDVVVAGASRRIGNLPNTARPWLVAEPIEPIGDEPLAPLTNRRQRHPKLTRDLTVGQAIRARNANACAVFARRANPSSVCRSGSVNYSNASLGPRPSPTPPSLPNCQRINDSGH